MALYKTESKQKYLLNNTIIDATNYVYILVSNEFHQEKSYNFITKWYIPNAKRWRKLIYDILVFHKLIFILSPYFSMHKLMCVGLKFSLASFMCSWFVAKGHYQRIANVDLFVINMPSSWRENAAIRLRIIYIIKQSLRSHLFVLVKVRWFNLERIVFNYINVCLIFKIINLIWNIYS